MIFRTTDGGTTWANINYGGPSMPLSGIKFTDSQTGYIWGGSGTSGRGVLFKRTDAGTTRTNLNFPYNTTMLYFFIPVSDAAWVMTGSFGNVFRTKDGGQTWKSYSFGFTISSAGKIIASYVYGDTLIEGGVGAQIVKFAEPTVIPVELTSCTTSVVKKGVKLEWSVESELNNRGFKMERKATDSEAWVSLGYVEGKGNSASVSVYNLRILTSPQANITIDCSGLILTEQQPFIIRAPRLSLFCLLISHSHSTAPNPFNPSTIIYFTLPEKASVKL